MCCQMHRYIVKNSIYKYILCKSDIFSFFYFKYFVYLFVAVFKRYHIWFPHLNYKRLFITADFKQVIYPKISKYNSWRGWHAREPQSIHMSQGFIIYLFKVHKTNSLKLFYYSLSRYYPPSICLPECRTWNKSQTLRRLLHCLQISILLQMYIFECILNVVITLVSLNVSVRPQVVWWLLCFLFFISSIFLNCLIIVSCSRPINVLHYFHN